MVREWWFLVLLAVWGGVLGSFLNVWVMRSLEGESWMWGRSRCDHCGHQLSWWENLPLLSYIWLRGRCRACGKRIKIQHVVMELLMASLFVWWGLIGWGFFRLVDLPGLRLVQSLFWLVIGVSLVVVALTDWFYGVVPEVLIWVMGGLALAYRLSLWLLGVMSVDDLVKILVSAFGVWLFFYGLYRLTGKKGMGLGDVYLAPVLGLVLGWPRVVVGIMLAFVLGAVIGTVLMVRRKKTWKSSLPFAPFMVIGTMLALLWGYRCWQLLLVA